MEWGVQSGDSLAERAIVWSRTDRPARMFVEYAATEAFRNPVRVEGPYALETSDFTARVDLGGLPSGTDIHYRVWFESLETHPAASERVTGNLRTAPTGLQPIKFVWSGDTAGQGYGINPDWGGMRIYETMRRLEPHFFLHSGDTIYADSPIPPEIELPGGHIWRNLTTPETAKVAETLDEFRGRYRYNLMDENVRRFARQVPQIWQWDDHEVTNNWSGSKSLEADSRYQEKRVGLLVARATRAYLDYAPLRPHASDAQRIYRRIPYGPLLDLFLIDLRSYRGPNSFNRQPAESPETAFLGRPQLRWLKQGLLRSKATWKVIASDMPIGLMVGDGKDSQGRPRWENGANGNGPPLGRELEIADLLRFLKHNRIENTLWLTADVHYTAAHHYSPDRAQFQDFLPFWEFVSGPLHSGSFGPAALDNTFGPEVAFQKHPPPGQSNLPPSAGLQFFGEVSINSGDRSCTVRLRDVAGTVLYEKDLPPSAER